MKRIHAYILGFVFAFILWMIFYAYVFFQAGEHGWEVFNSSGVFILGYYLVALIVSFFAARDIYEETKTSIRLSVIYGIPVVILLIALAMSNGIENGGTFFMTSYFILSLIYVFSIFLKPSK